ncbi:MAG TPA: Uma2 family endonuclease [Pirellulaceae bacterium]|nr:Uma2 family endonuclease [Pirellulaceae bacterium]
MSSVIAPTFGFAFPPLTPQPRRFSCAEFHQLGDMGWFEGRRAMLIDGEILEMPGPNPPHATMTAKVDYTLRRYFTQGFVIRNQSPLVLGQATDPEPDLAVVAGKLMDFYSAHPTTAALVIEIADSTLAFDTTTKASLYAAAKIADYWVVDLVGKRLIVFRQPQPDSAQPFKAKYASVQPLQPPGTISPLSAPVASIPVADLLP